jgi:hypothetical protein
LPTATRGLEAAPQGPPAVHEHGLERADIETAELVNKFYGDKSSSHPPDWIQERRKHVQEHMPKRILDSSIRDAFEFQLREEIAAAVCLPVRNITIEEVRMLESTDDQWMSCIC